ncbi:MAG: peptidoglycan DD-metalloendopeptidase family protein [Oscillospiraceae bacterium]|nr:peptidoglycan DD-metalloendopeptidase family protein [Oscillospiraceae bacterium]
MFKKNVVLRPESFIEGFGESVISIIKLGFRTISEIFFYFSGIIWKKSGDIRKKVSLYLRYALIGLMEPVMEVYGRFERVFKDTAKTQTGGARLKAVLKGLNALMFGEDGLFISLFNVAAPVICIAFFIAVVNYSNSLSYGVRLEVDGSLYGYIENDSVFSEAEKLVDSRLNYLGSSRKINAFPVYTIEKTGGEFLSAAQVADLMLSNSGISVQQAYGIYMDGLLVGAVTDNSGIVEALDGILERFKTGLPDEKVEFVRDLDYTQGGVYTTESIIEPQIIIDQVTSLKQQASYYTVEVGDSPSLISDKLDMSIDEIEALNPGFSEGIAVGEKVQYSVDVAFLDVAVTYSEVYEVHEPFRTIYHDDDGMYVDTTRVIRPGEPGISRVSASVSTVNGVERERVITSAFKLSEPVDEIVARGTKQIETGSVSSESAGYGKFIWPVPRYSVGTIERHHQDGGYAGHSGIDFSAPYGTPVYAGDGGLVVLSGWHYDYGTTVIIEHPNGYRTLYAHNSQNFVSVGEYVAQGQQIGAVGQTGRAWGNHVHFEVIRNGIKVNPRQYLDNL